MTFTETNTVNALVRDVLCGGVIYSTTVGPGLARRHGELASLGWHYIGPQHLTRQAHKVPVLDQVRKALIRGDPEIRSSRRFPPPQLPSRSVSPSRTSAGGAQPAIPPLHREPLECRL